ncbi:MAG: diaminopropionate ammonia-lyase [Candidatus Dormibacteria bacterium]
MSWYVQDAHSYAVQPSQETRWFHTRLPGYQATRLVRADSLASDLGLGEVWVKDESSRLGYPSFKILGASWATYRALQATGGFADGDWTTVEDLAGLVARTTKVRRLAAATDGNHGWAVAHVAGWLGMAASIFLPTGASRARIDAIRGEGATVEVVDGGYGDAVRRSALEATEECLVISDTSWEGYVNIPRWVIEGYATIFVEADEQLRAAGAKPLTAMVVQVGVGALAGAAVRYVRSDSARRGVRLIAVEPLAAACNLESMRAGEMVTIPGPHDSIMVGLNCDTPSLVAWPDVSAGFDVFVAVDDDAARAAMRALAWAGIVAGETGAAGVAGLTELRCGKASACGAQIGLGPDSQVLVLATEGATDPQSYASIVASTQKSGGQA